MLIEKIVCDYEIDIVELEVSVGHLQMVVRGEPKVILADAMQVIKSISAGKFFRLGDQKSLLLGRETVGIKYFVKLLVMKMKRSYTCMPILNKR